MRVFIALFLAFSLAACGGGAGSGMSMTDAAKQFLESTFKGDRQAWEAVACEALKAQSGVSGSVTQADGLTVDFSAVRYSIKEERGDEGTVSISGTVKMTAAGFTMEQNLRDLGLSELPMKREGGSWKACPKAEVTIN